MLRGFATGGEASGDMHDDFKPQFKEQRSGSAEDAIRHDVTTNKVLLYMKVGLLQRRIARKHPFIAAHFANGLFRGAAALWCNVKRPTRSCCVIKVCCLQLPCRQCNAGLHCPSAFLQSPVCLQKRR